MTLGKVNDDSISFLANYPFKKELSWAHWYIKVKGCAAENTTTASGYCLLLSASEIHNNSHSAQKLGEFGLCQQHNPSGGILWAKVLHKKQTTNHVFPVSLHSLHYSPLHTHVNVLSPFNVTSQQMTYFISHCNGLYARPLPGLDKSAQSFPVNCPKSSGREDVFLHSLPSGFTSS